ncbi:MAG: hypothetical protein JJU01_00540 [Alkalibacterium sp.]|nr:hypothetical protein [Alkalibacterium sp.]TVP93294.1 MAG: hypothetical protein EA249_00575 [Alkalibacterium sp.]
MTRLLIKIKNWPNSLKIILASLLTILAGGFLLSLPLSHASGQTGATFDHFYTAASLVSINSMTSIEFSETYSLFGKTVAIVLMQIGGLGLMTFLAFVTLLMNQRMSHSQKDLLSDVLNRYRITNMQDYLKQVFKYTFIIETSGFILLSFRFIPQYGLTDGLFHSLFLSVSAFTNAGFISFGPDSLKDYINDPWTLSVVMLLVFLGGIGHIVWFDFRAKIRFFILNYKKMGFKRLYNRLEVATQMILNATFILIIFGIIWVLVTEWTNPDTLGEVGVIHRFYIALFQSVTMRTAGFSILEFHSFRQGTVLILLALAIVGTAPGSTGGGIKVTTVAVIVLSFISEIKGQKSVAFSKRDIPIETVKQAMVIFISIFVLLYTGILMLMWSESESFYDLTVQATAAVSTVGITGNDISDYTRVGQTIIGFLFFAGRLGPLSVFMGLIGRQKKERERIYPDIDIMLG